MQRSQPCGGWWLVATDREPLWVDDELVRAELRLPWCRPQIAAVRRRPRRPIHPALGAVEICTWPSSSSAAPAPGPGLGHPGTIGTRAVGHGCCDRRAAASEEPAWARDGVARRVSARRRCVRLAARLTRPDRPYSPDVRRRAPRPRPARSWRHGGDGEMSAGSGCADRTTIMVRASATQRPRGL